VRIDDGLDHSAERFQHAKRAKKRKFLKKPMISVSNVSMRYGAKILFDEVSTAFTPGKRYGLTGPNGAGKTTFMNLLSGELEPQKGSVVRPKKLSVHSQDQFAFDA
jgi:ATPase subunit of ABC transporter with duplicated ATPase domains